MWKIEQIGWLLVGEINKLNALLKAAVSRELWAHWIHSPFITWGLDWKAKTSDSFPKHFNYLGFANCLPGENYLGVDPCHKPCIPNLCYLVFFTGEIQDLPILWLREKNAIQTLSQKHKEPPCQEVLVRDRSPLPTLPLSKETFSELLYFFFTQFP